jgi:acetolactate decarboxylase
LIEASTLQAEWKLDSVPATFVAFWSPQYAARLDVPGYHLHVVDDARRRGGHVLECSSGPLTVGVQRLEQLVVALPETADFLRADLDADPAPTIDRVERSSDTR